MLIFDLSLSRSGALVQKAPYNQATALTYNTIWIVKSVISGSKYLKFYIWRQTIAKSGPIGLTVFTGLMALLTV